MFFGELTESQKGPANKLCARKKMLLAWPQGTGKTIISLASSEKLLEIQSINHILILTPTSIGWQWKEKIEEFTDHGNDVRLIEAKDRSSREYGSNQAIYTICPYSIFRKDYKGLLSQNYDLIIADEAQEFSSFRSKTFKIIQKFKVPYRWALTGTAISNRLEELYAIFRWVDPYLLPPWQKFEAMHLVRNPKTKQILKYRNITGLHEYLSATRLDRKVGLEGLPKLIPQKIYIEKDTTIRNTEIELFNTLHNYTGSDSRIKFDPLTSSALHSARQAVISEPKLRKCIDLVRTILSECSENRIVIFSYYKQPIYDLLQQLGSLATVYTGDESSHDKQANFRLFATGQKRILICSDAGKAGLDIPFANYTIHLDVPYSFSTMDQRSKRTQRYSSEFTSIVVIYLLVKDSIEEYYYEVTSNKGKLSKAVQEGGADTVIMRDRSLKAYLDGIIRRENRRVATAKAE